MKNSTKFFTIGAVAGGLATLAGAAMAAYSYALRPRIVRWGATDDEVRRTLPGDSLVEKPRLTVTHAITIDAPREKVFPYLKQLGRGRGGFYSYSFIENEILGLGIQNAETVQPELQDVQAADRVELPMRFVAEMVMKQENHMLVFHGDTRTARPGEAPKLPPGDFLNLTWGFYLEELPEDKTRLVERMRADFPPSFRNNLLYGAILEPGSFVMERRMLLGIKERAEGTYKPRKTEFKLPEMPKFDARRFGLKPIRMDDGPGREPVPAHEGDGHAPVAATTNLEG